MKKLILILAGCFLSIVSVASPDDLVAEYNADRIRYAEKVVLIEQTWALSSMARKNREECGGSFGSGATLELAIGLVGTSNNKITNETLVRMIGINLDGAGAESLSCVIINKKESIIDSLKNANAKILRSSCVSLFNDLSKRELAIINDVPVDLVCKTDQEIQSEIKRFLQAIESNSICDE